MMSSSDEKDTPSVAPAHDPARREFLQRAAGAAGLAAAASAAGVAAQEAAKPPEPAKPKYDLKGTMTEFKSGELTIPAYVSRPAKKSKAPAVLVIHEIFGLNDHIKSVADRAAAAGYVAIAPHFFARAAEQPPAATSTDPQAMRRAASAIKPEDANKDMQAALDFLKKDKGVKPRFASVGFCMGGGWSYRLAAHSKDLAGAVIYYGRTPLELVEQVNCPLLGNFAERDNITPESVQAWAEALRKAGKQVDIKIYPGARHGFNNDTREAHDPAASADAWQRTLKFFRERLGE